MTEAALRQHICATYDQLTVGGRGWGDRVGFVGL
ncbi:hypothetical protein CCACVL1_14062 [Corchorus capsularis]|uniref:Uncharacterized protein n=1 Tax=Corchorus capsularis TaxID=210143 RepID=A0A1R3I8B6_COCAP|nr:hypothetical protein CCACVL1_14062 [Corchorus capsularis]